MKKVFGIICAALALLATVNLVKTLASGNSNRGHGSAAYESGRKVGAFSAPIVFGALAIWLLRSADRPRRTSPPPLPTGSIPTTPATPFLKRKLVWIASAMLVLVGLFVVSALALGIISRMRSHRAGLLTQAPGDRMSRDRTTPPGALPRIEFHGRAIDFTNLHGRIFSGVKLVRTDGIVLFVSRPDGHVEPVFLNQIPLPVLMEAGIPTNWPGVMKGRPLGNSSFMTPPVRPVPASPGQDGFLSGQAVEVQWGGRWQTGTVLASRGFSVQVRLQNAAMPAPIWVSTNRIRPLK